MTHVPLGLRDYLPQDIQQRETIIKKMADVVKQSGYQRIITPTIERFDLVRTGLGTLSNQCIMFFDGGGSRLVLRPDHTTAIARISSSRLSHELPIKLFYHDSVFRKDPVLGETEIYQFGFEHIGSLSIFDELKMIHMVSKICDAVGLKDYQIHLAHPEILRQYGDDQLNALRQGNLIPFNELPRIGQSELASEFEYLGQLYSKSNLNELDNVYINLGLYKDPAYYNGVYFDVVSSAYGKVLGSGGRYDSVLNSFDLNANAFGFAFRLHYLERALDQQ
ncbi:MAG: ATP phosphoribosyltransferase regulatory subunit [Candidatus Margulisiibacteriota bacterium]